MRISGNERRNRIIEMLRTTATPLSGSQLANLLGVSRQVIVTDIALLKTEIPARFHAEEIMRKRETLKIIDIDMPSEQLQAYFRQWGE